MEQRFLQTGEIYVSSGAVQIITVLGSCIAVCLYDSERGLGGMNHYLLPLWNHQGFASPRYGNVAIEKLISAMEEKGAIRQNMVAKVFGGAQMYRDSTQSFMIGERNVIVAREMLKQSGIALAASDTGGTDGRKIIFDLTSGKVQMKYLSRRKDDSCTDR